LRLIGGKTSHPDCGFVFRHSIGDKGVSQAKTFFDRFRLKSPGQRRIRQWVKKTRGFAAGSKEHPPLAVTLKNKAGLSHTTNPKERLSDAAK
jgi:hypothetical protein